VEDTHQDRMACVEAKQGVVVGHPSDGENLKTSKTAENPSSFAFLFTLPIFLRISIGLA
jgi:hypothetical protein